MDINEKQDCGVYKILNTLNGNFYIGSTTTPFSVRWGHHRSSLRRNKHKNHHLQMSWNKYGESNFKFIPIEKCDSNKCFIREQYYLDNLTPYYNILKNAGTVLGYNHTEETKKKISLSQVGEKHWSYLGEFVFYHNKFGYYVGDILSFIFKFDLTKDLVYRMCRRELSFHKNWICVGKFTNGFTFPPNINQIYRDTLNRHGQYFVFYNGVDNFIGTVGEFVRKYDLIRDRIDGIVDGSRLSASNWICLGKFNESFKFPLNVNEIYQNRISKNNRVKDIINKKFTFYNENTIISSTVKEFCDCQNFHREWIKRVCRGVRKSYKGWRIKEMDVKWMKTT